MVKLSRRAASWIPVVALCPLVALIWFNNRLGVAVRAPGMHTQNDAGQDIIVLSPTSEPELVGSTIHEFFHDLKSAGQFDYDIPYAATFGYYTEWRRYGRLSDRNRDADLRRGMAIIATSFTIDTLLSPYQSRHVSESPRSYSDGAFFAGLLAKRYGQNADTVRKYVFSLAMGASPADAEVLAVDDSAYAGVLGVRNGRYTRIDEEALGRTLSEATPQGRRVVERYIAMLQENYAIQFRIQSDGRHKVDATPASDGVQPQAPSSRTPSRPQTSTAAALSDMRFTNGRPGRRWPGRVLYAFDNSIAAPHRAMFKAVTDEIGSQIGLPFQDCTATCTDTNSYVFVVNDSVDYSYVGMVGGRQLFGVSHWSPDTLAHLVRHVLGLGEQDGEVLVR